MTPGGEAGQSRCQATAKHGGACGSFALPGRPWCIAHDPDRLEQRTAARAKGGAVASKLRMLRGRRARLDTVAGLVPFTASLLHDVLEGRVSTDIGRTVFYGLSIQVKHIELAQVIPRLQQLEARIEERASPRRFA